MYNVIKGTLELFLESTAIITVLLSAFNYSNKQILKTSLIFFLYNFVNYNIIFSNKIYQTILMCLSLVFILKHYCNFKIRNTFYALPISIMFAFLDVLGILFLQKSQFLLYATLYKLVVIFFFRYKNLYFADNVFKSQMLTNMSYALMISTATIINIVIGGGIYDKFIS